MVAMILASRGWPGRYDLDGVRCLDILDKYRRERAGVSEELATAVACYAERMSKKVAIVTGASSGIGLACATQLSEGGFAVVLVGRREAPLLDAGESLPGESLVVTADVGGRSSAEMIVDTSVKQFGRVDALVNNAGYAPLTKIEETTPEELERVYEVNTLGAGRLILEAWPVMVRQGSGVIVNVSSMATADPFPGFFAYAGAKAGVELMARSCAAEGARHGVRAYAVAPGAVETPMLRSIIDEEVVPADRTLAPEAVAEVIVGCVAGQRREKTGTTIRLPSS